MSKIIPTEKARQGRQGRQVLYVLLGGLALALVAWVAAELYGEWIDPKTNIEGVAN